MARPEHTIFGAIRWDAWMPEKEGGTGNPGFQIARTLNDPKYRWRSPFFAEMKNETDITWPEYTQEIWEEEADYAAAAGIDYFAYLWYPDNMDLSMARKRHMASKNPDRVKMCAILEHLPHLEADIAQLVQAMKSSYYLRTDGKPVVYCYTSFEADNVPALRELMKSNGVQAELFLITMGGLDCEKAAKAGYDGISRYSIAGSNGEPFSNLRQKVLGWHDRLLADDFPIIPFVSAGWDPRPRHDRPVRWMNVPEYCWAQNAAPQELGQHLEEMLEWNEAHRDHTPTNLMISYAWNEHDEGGWLCPTIRTDANGVPLKENGKLLHDTSRLDAVAKVLKERR